MDLSEKKALLERTIAEKGSVLVAYSGGVDSGLLAYLAHTLCQENYRCVLLDSPLVPREALREAVDTANDLGLALEIIPAPHLVSEPFIQNPPDRCYLCKKISSRILKGRAGELGLSCVADGLNRSDTGEYRPGTRAGDEEGIIHPFIVAGITKEDIRAIARDLGLPFWDKPSAACLASRIPYGEAITGEKLAMAERGEEYLRMLGVRQARVRYHGNIARIEADEGGMAIIFARKGEVVNEFRKIGFTFTALDLTGYRSGSMDETLGRSWRHPAWMKRPL